MSNSTNDKDLRAVFERKFANEGATPPAPAWTAIQASLPKAKPFWKIGGWFFAGIILVAITSVSLLYFSSKSKAEISKKLDDTATLQENKWINSVAKTNRNAEKNDTQTTENKSLIETEQTLQQVKSAENTEAKQMNNGATTIQNTQKMEQKLVTSTVVSSSKIEVSHTATHQRSTKGEKNYSKTNKKVVKQNDTPERVTKLINRSEATTVVIGKDTDQNENGNQSGSANIKEVLVNTSNETISNEDFLRDKSEVGSLGLLKPKLLSTAYFLQLASISPKKLQPYYPISFDFYVARGKNFRSYSGFRDQFDIKSSELGEKTIAMRNGAYGFNLGFRLPKAWSFHTGLSLGRNVWTSPWVVKQLQSQQIIKNGGYEVNTSEGKLRLATAETATYFANPSDSALVKIRLVQRSAYISIPFVFRYTLPTKTWLQPYVGIGGAIDLKSRDRSRLIIDKAGSLRTSSLARLKNSGGLKSAFILSLGMSTAPTKRIGLFTELNFSKPFGSYKNALYKVTSSQFQFRLGMTINF
jgi:hypothetical protein